MKSINLCTAKLLPLIMLGNGLFAQLELINKNLQIIYPLQPRQRILLNNRMNIIN
jgi:hypothetical protein